MMVSQDFIKTSHRKLEPLELPHKNLNVHEVQAFTTGNIGFGSQTNLKDYE